MAMDGEANATKFDQAIGFWARCRQHSTVVSNEIVNKDVTRWQLNKLIDTWNGSDVWNRLWLSMLVRNVSCIRTLFIFALRYSKLVCVGLYSNFYWFYVTWSVGNHGGDATGEVLLFSFTYFLFLQFRCSCTSYCGSWLKWDYFQSTIFLPASHCFVMGSNFPDLFMTFTFCAFVYKIQNRL
jgi:hypothetical protein